MLQILGTLHRAFWYKIVISGSRVYWPPPLRMVPISGNHVHAFLTIALVPPCIFWTITIIKNLHYMSFSKNEGGYRRPFRIFPKIHPIWRSYPSLMYITAPRFRGMKYQGQCCHQLLPAVFSSVFIFRLDTLAVWWWKDYVLLSNGQIYKGKLDTRDLHKACVESLQKIIFLVLEKNPQNRMVLIFAK